MTDRHKPPAESQITRTFIEHGAFLKRFLGRILKHDQDVEDVAQEAYLRAFDAEKYQLIERPRAFLFSTARNLALNELTRKSRQMTSLIEDCQKPYEESDDSEELLLEGKQALGAYCEAVASLPDLSRQIYILRKVHGLKHKEIAERLNISLSSVEKHLRMGAGVCMVAMRRHHGDALSSVPRKSGMAVGKGGKQ